VLCGGFATYRKGEGAPASKLLFDDGKQLLQGGVGNTNNIDKPTAPPVTIALTFWGGDTPKRFTTRTRALLIWIFCMPDISCDTGVLSEWITREGVSMRNLGSLPLNSNLACV